MTTLFDIDKVVWIVSVTKVPEWNNGAKPHKNRISLQGPFTIREIKVSASSEVEYLLDDGQFVREEQVFPSLAGAQNQLKALSEDVLSDDRLELPLNMHYHEAEALGLIDRVYKQVEEEKKLSAEEND